MHAGGGPVGVGVCVGVPSPTRVKVALGLVLGVTVADPVPVGTPVAVSVGVAVAGRTPVGDMVGVFDTLGVRLGDRDGIFVGVGIVVSSDDDDPHPSSVSPVANMTRVVDASRPCRERRARREADMKALRPRVWRAPLSSELASCLAASSRSWRKSTRVESLSHNSGFAPARPWSFAVVSDLDA
jgi:hypothetical protein